MVKALRLFTAFLLVITIQTAWLADWRPFGVPGDVMLMMAIAGGMTAGPERGAVIGFISGLLLDMTMTTPMGLAALVYLIVGFCVGVVNAGVIRSAPWIPVAVTVGATIFGVGLYVITGVLLGQDFRLPNLVEVFVVTGVMNALVCWPILWLVRWAERPDHAARYAR